MRIENYVCTNLSYEQIPHHPSSGELHYLTLPKFHSRLLQHHPSEVTFFTTCSAQIFWVCVCVWGGGALVKHCYIIGIVHRYNDLWRKKTKQTFITYGFKAATGAKSNMNLIYLFTPVVYLQWLSSWQPVSLGSECKVEWAPAGKPRQECIYMKSRFTFQILCTFCHCNSLKMLFNTSYLLWCQQTYKDLTWNVKYQVYSIKAMLTCLQD